MAEKTPDTAKANVPKDIYDVEKIGVHLNLKIKGMSKPDNKKIPGRRPGN
jgi:hypothetical protein